MNVEGLTKKSKELAQQQEKVNNSFAAQGLLAKGGSLLKTGLSALLNAGTAVLAEMAISGLVTYFDNIIHHQEKIIEKGKEARQIIEETSAAFNETKSYVDENGEEYINLREGVDPETNKNISLSSDEYEKFLSIGSELATLFPELVIGYDAQGNALLNLSTNAGTAAEQLNNLLEQERALADYKIAENIQTDFNGVLEQQKILQKDLSKYYTDRSTLEKTLSDLYASESGNLANIQEGFVEDKTTGIFENLFGTSNDTFKNYTKAIATDNEGSDILIKALYDAANEVGIENLTAGALDELGRQTYDFSATEEQIKALYESYSRHVKGLMEEQGQDVEGELAELNASIAMDEREVEALWQSFVPSLISSMNIYSGYSELSDGIKQAINTAIGDIDYSNLAESDQENIRQYARRTFLDPFLEVMDSGNEEAQTAIENLFSMDGSQLTANEYAKQIEEYLLIIKQALIDADPINGGKTYNDFATLFGFKTKEGDILKNQKEIILDDIKESGKITEKDLDLYNTLGDTLTWDQLVEVNAIVSDETFSGTLTDAVNKALENAEKEINEVESITFSSLLADESDTGLSKYIDAFQNSISSIQGAFEKLNSGDLTSSELIDLIQEFPQLAEETDNLGSSLNDLAVDHFVTVMNQIQTAMQGVTDPVQLAAMKAFTDELKKQVISTVDLTNLTTDNLITKFADSTSYDNWDKAGFDTIFGKLVSEFGSTDEGKAALLTLAAEIELDPSLAYKSYNILKSHVEDNVLLAEVELNDKKLTDLQHSLEDLQSEATTLESDLSLKDARGVQKLANDYEDLIDNSKEQIKNLRSQNSLLEIEKSKLDATDQRYRDIQNQINSNNSSIRSAIQSQLEWNKAASQLPEQVTTKYDAYTRALNSSNPSDIYASIVSGKEDADTLWEQGWVGKDDFTTYAQLLAKNGESLYDAIANYEANAERLSKYFTSDTSGLYSFLDDGVAKTQELEEEWIKLGKNGYEFDIDNLSEFADAMDMSTELAGHFLIAIRDMGYEVDLSIIGDGFAEQFGKVDYSANNAAQQVQTLINEMSTLASADVDITGSVDQAANALKILEEQGVDVSGMLEQLNELGNMNGFHINDDFTVTFNTLQNAYNKIAEYQNLSVNVDANVEGEEQLNTLAQELAGMDQQTLIDIGFKASNGETITAEDIKNQIGTVEIPLEYVTSNTEETSASDSTITVDANMQPAEEKVSTWVDKTNQTTATTTTKNNTLPAVQATNELINDINSRNAKVQVGANVDDLMHTINEALTGPFAINVTANVNGLPQKEGVVATGTMLSVARADGSAYNMLNLKPAFVNGNVSLTHNEEALVNELGTESIIRNGIWSLIPGGMHVESLKKGDIILSASQTKSLLEAGKASGHGRVVGGAYANGTAFNGMSAYNLNMSVTGGTNGNYTKRPTTSSSDSGNTVIKQNTDATNKNTVQHKKSTAAQTKNLKSFQAWLDKLKDWVEVRLQRLQESIDLSLAKSENAVGHQNKNQHISTAQKTITQLIDDNISGANEYYAQADLVKDEAVAANLFKKKSNGKKRTKAEQKNYAESLIEKIENGTIDISKYGEKTKAFIESYQEWYDKAKACEQAVEDLKQQQRDLAQQKLDNITDQYDAMISHIEHSADLINGFIDQAEIKGYMESTKYYDALIKNASDQKSDLEKERAALMASLQKSMDDGIIKENSVEWYNMQGQINEVSKAIQDADTEMLEFADTIRTIGWDRFDRLQESIGRITEESDFLIDLMSNDELFTDKGAITDQGMATMGLYGVNHNTYMSQADKYRAEMDEIQKLMQTEEGQYDTKLIDRYRELEDAQRDCILAAEDQKQAMKDLIQEGIDKQLESLDELIDKYKETLQSQSDLNDYQNDIADQTKELASLQKQLAILGNDDSEENRLRKQKAENELKEVQKQLEQTEYDKYISDQEELLDNMREEYEELLNERLNNIDEVMAETITQINASASSISETLTKESDAVGYRLTTEMQDIWGENGVQGVLTTYSADFKSATTNVQTTIDSIKAGIDKLVSGADEQADTDIEASSAGGSSNPRVGLTPVTPTPTPTEPTKPAETPKTDEGKKKSSGDGKIKVGEKVKFASGKYTANSAGGGASGNKKLGKSVYVTKINKGSSRPYHISTGKKFGSGDLGWVKKKQLSGYWTGTDFVKEDEFARINERGSEIITLPDGSMIMPLKQGSGVINNPTTERLQRLADLSDELIASAEHQKQLLLMAQQFEELMNMQQRTIDTNAINSVGSSQVTNHNQFVFNLEGIKTPSDWMQWAKQSKDFEGMIQAMTIGRINGGSKLAKNKYKK